MAANKFPHGAPHGYERKTTIRAIVSPSMRELYWAAGFMEGEANFRGERTTEQVTVGQVQKEPLLRLQAMFGGSVRARKVKPQPHYGQCWLWVVCGSRARGVMLTMFALLSPKRRAQIHTALRMA